jgi:hypothetical protein
MHRRSNAVVIAPVTTKTLVVRFAWTLLLAMVVGFALVWLAAQFEIPFVTEAGGA